MPPRILILSSQVAASPVGGLAQTRVLADLDIDAILAPTVLFGRHPGLGPPGGGTVSEALFGGVLAGIEADGVFATLTGLITGYFATEAQVAIAARTIDTVRQAAPGVRIIVDPVMGDTGRGLYVQAEVAEAISAHLVPRADLLAPNAWELQRLSGQAVSGPASALAAARSMGRPVLVSSVELGPSIGVVYVDRDNAWLASHQRLNTAPNGTGDRLTAVFVGAQARGSAPRDALAMAVASVAAWVGVRGEVVLEALT